MRYAQTHKLQLSGPTVHSYTVVETDLDEPTVVEVNKKPKETDNNKSFHRQKKKDESIIIGDSMVKGLRQHSITKATKTKTLVRSFSGAKIKDLKHYILHTSFGYEA